MRPRQTHRHRPNLPKLPPLVALALLAATAGGCRTTDPALISADGRELRELPSAPYRVAIAPVSGIELGNAGDPSSDLTFRYDNAALQRHLARVLEDLQAATEVVLIDTPAEASGGQELGMARDAVLARAREMHADLIIRPKVLAPATLAADGNSDRWATATGLWFLAWAGNWVESRAFHAKLALEFQVESPHHASPLTRFKARCDQLDLTHWERHRVISLSTLLSVFLPPVVAFPGDNLELTSTALSSRMSTRIGTRLAKFLKEDLSTLQRDHLGELTLTSPRNGQQVGTKVSVQGEVFARYPLHELRIYVDDLPPIVLGPDRLGSDVTQRRANGYVAEIDEVLSLTEGRRLIAFEMTIRGELSSRTLIVECVDEGSP